MNINLGSGCMVVLWRYYLVYMVVFLLHFAGISFELPIFAKMLIHFRFGENRALLGQEISKGHAGFFREFFY
jgi:hypothetical protein